MTLPKPLENTLRKILQKEYPAFQEALLSPLTTSLHINRSKAPPPGHLPLADKTPWYADGHYLSERPAFGLDPLFHAGAYYVQEASSMFLAEAVRQLPLEKEGSGGLKVLDLCAAPGGKSTLLASILADNSLILCNEVIASRYKVLRQNIDKWGRTNTWTAQHAPEALQSLQGWFDLVVVDAPCSGEGMLRKTSEVLSQWSEKVVKGCALRQRTILAEACNLLRPGGHLIYSTCTFNPEENIDNAVWIAEQGFDPIRLNTLPEWQIVEVAQQHTYGYAFFPHRVQGEGFFLAAFRKKETRMSAPHPKKRKKPRHSNWRTATSQQYTLAAPFLAQPEAFDFLQNDRGQIKVVRKEHQAAAALIESSLRQKAVGLLLGEVKGKQLVPSHPLALSTAIAPDLPALEVPKEAARSFFRKEPFDLPNAGMEHQTGWALIRHRGLNLGWIKRLPNRFNNYLPQAWRIRF